MPPPIDAAVGEAKKALEEGSPDEMEQAYEGLTQASHQVAAVCIRARVPRTGSGAPVPRQLLETATRQRN